MADAVSDRIVVRADPDRVLEVISDFESYPAWQDEIREVEVLETDEDGWGTRVRLVVDARLFRTTMVLAYSYTATSMRWELVEGDQVRRNDGRYDLTDLGDGTTAVEYRLEIEPTVPVPVPLRRRAARRIVEGALAGMKRRVEVGGDAAGHASGRPSRPPGIR